MIHAQSNQHGIAILGGSFDPVHNGHIELAKTMINLLQPSELRIIPSGWSWQKSGFHAQQEHRIAMLNLAFQEFSATTPLVIDLQEIERAKMGIPSYSVDTLRNLRQQFGPGVALMFLMGYDQLCKLDSWKDWQELFDLTHIIAFNRPSYLLDEANEVIKKEINQRSATIQEIQTQPCGAIYLCKNLDIDISSTQLRGELADESGTPEKLPQVPPAILDYIQQHQLYNHHGH